MRIINFTKNFYGTMAVMAAALFLMTPLPANAAEIDFTSLVDVGRDFVMSAATAIAVALAGFIAMKMRQWFGIELDAKYRVALHDAIDRGMGSAIAIAFDKVEDGATVEVDSEVKANVANYVTRNTPDALKHFGLTPDRLGDIISAKFGALVVNRIAKHDRPSA